MAFHSTHYQRVQSSEEDLLEEDLPPTVVSPRSLDERGEMFYCKYCILVNQLHIQLNTRWAKRTLDV